MTEPVGPPNGRRKFRYDVRYLKIEDGGYHECTGQIIAVLSSSYNAARKTWYITGLVRKDWVDPHLSPGEEVWSD